MTKKMVFIETKDTMPLEGACKNLFPRTFYEGRSRRCGLHEMNGSVRSLKDSVSPEVLEALVTVAGGEVVGPYEE